MRRHGSWYIGALLLAALATQACAQDGACRGPVECHGPNVVYAPSSDVEVEQQCYPPVCYAPTMFGDFLGLAIFPAPGQVQIFQGQTPYTTPVDRGGYKIAENEAPRPQNRVFASYNYYDQVSGPVPLSGVHRQIIGFEKTFNDGKFSLGVRQPFYELYGGTVDRGIEDVAGIFKYALYNNDKTGTLFSIGTMVTAPTGTNPNLRLADGTAVHPILIQPFLGWFWGCDQFYAHGFSSVLASTDRSDLSIAFIDIGIGYSIYQCPDAWVSAIIPTIEGHANMPLNSSGLLDYRDVFNFTGGVNIVFNQKSSLGIAMGTPVFGYNAYTFEGLLNFNCRF